jgi:hypothetical protein
MDAVTFCAILAGAIDTEAPIRGYTQSSRQYLAHHHRAMAQYVGGQVDAAGRVVTVGLWEREEKRHTPTLIKLHRQLSGQKPTVVPHSARPYRPSGHPRQDLYRHGLHRIATEYGATALYLWLMAHCTGATRQVLAQLLIDEISHTVRFWGYGRWAYPETSLAAMGHTLAIALVEKIHRPSTQGSLLHTLRRMQGELAWSQWRWHHRLTFLYTLDQVMRRLWQWSATLSPADLNDLFGPPPEVQG